MNSRQKNLFIALLMFFAAALLTPSIGHGQNECDQLVVDEANVFGKDITRVESAAQELVKAGADVRVRTIRTFAPADNLDRFEMLLERQCASWTAPDGTRKNNLIVLMISSEERKTGLYYGSQWENVLGAHWTRIQTEVMNPHFRQGDFVGGFVNGLREVRRLVDRQVSGGAKPEGAGASPFRIVLFGVFFLSTSIAGVFFFRARGRTKERRRAAQQKARLAKQAAASLVNELVQKVQMLEIKINATAAKVSEDDIRPLQEGLGKARQLVDNGAQSYSELSHSAGDPNNPKLSEAQYSSLEEAYKKVLVVLREGNSVVSDVEKWIDSLQEVMAQLPSAIAEVKTAMTEAVEKQGAARKGGLKTDYPAELLGKARQSLEQAVASSQKKQFAQAMQYANEAQEMASQAAKEAEELPLKKQEAEAGIAALPSRIERVKEAIVQGRGIFERIRGTYAPSSWQSIVGNGTEAENRINWALESLEAARAAATMEQQDWKKGLEILQTSNSWLDEAESFLRSIAALEVNLAAAQRDAPGEISAAQADISKAWDYIHKYDEDIRESLEEDLRQAERKLESATNELKKEKADYLEVCQQAREANASADKILAEARNEHEATERVRAKAATALRDARASVSKAKEYIEDHSRDVAGTAKEYLRDAQDELFHAERASDPSVRVSHAEKAESAAETAYSMAREDVARAERSRQERRDIEGRPWGSPSVGRRSVGGGGGRFSRGGGSSDWGSGGGGGGGSTGW